MVIGIGSEATHNSPPSRREILASTTAFMAQCRGKALRPTAATNSPSNRRKRPEIDAAGGPTW